MNANPMASTSPDTLKLRLLSGIPALLLVLAILGWAPPVVAAVVVALLGVLGMHEYQRMWAGPTGWRLPHIPTLLAGLVIGIGQVVWGLTGTLALSFIAVHIVMTPTILVEQDRSRVLRLWGIGIAGVIAVPFTLNHLGLLAQLPHGSWLLFFMVLAVSLNDSLAYFVGKTLGRHLLMPSVSPRKTWEGAIGGVLGGMAAGAVFANLPLDTGLHYSLGQYLAAGALLAVAGQISDLAESKLKRVCGVKDSGRFLPGHGGLLDRVDAYFLAGPLAYYLVFFLGQG